MNAGHVVTQWKSCLIEGLHATVMVGFVGVNDCD